MNTNYASLGIEEIKANVAQIKAVQKSKNLSSTEVDTLSQKIDELDIKLKADGEKFTKAKSAITASASDITQARQVLAADKAQVDDVKAALSKVTLSIEAVNVTSAENIVAPISTTIQPIVTQTTHLSRLFPTFLTIIIMFVSIMLAATLVISEKTTNAFFRNFISPTKDWIFLIGAYLTCLLIVAVQMVIIIFVARFFLESASLTGLNTLFIPLLLISTLFIFIGLIIGYLFNSQETGTLASLFLVSGSLLFSNTVLPLESVPQGVKSFLLYNPFVLSEIMLRKVLLFGFSLVQLVDQMKIMVIYIGILVVICYLSLKMYKARLG